ncbi:conserved hypothetical protein [Trichinella spiralis]|uniref:hypothetical protein n=1 Tax=Trichinella spiralis TaxID=6334 RepID=UPI0001EFED2C|nr:conserved hypothetical protein [Trichinella spiralis]
MKFILLDSSKNSVHDGIKFFSSRGLNFVKFVKQITLLNRARYSAHFDTKLRKGLDKRNLFGTKKNDYRTEFGIKMCRITCFTQLFTRVFLKWGGPHPNNPTTYLTPTIHQRCLAKTIL